MKLALRTQQVLAHEAGVAEVVDPLAGSYYVEALTAQIEAGARALIAADRGAGRDGEGDRVRLGAAADRRRLLGAPAPGRGGRAGGRGRQPVRRARARARWASTGMLEEVGEERRAGAGRAAGGARRGARGARARARCGPPPPATTNLVPVLVEAVKTYATIGEICGVLREVFGEYRALQVLLAVSRSLGAALPPGLLARLSQADLPSLLGLALPFVTLGADGSLAPDALLLPRVARGGRAYPPPRHRRREPQRAQPGGPPRRDPAGDRARAHGLREVPRDRRAAAARRPGPLHARGGGRAGRPAGRGGG